MKRILKKRGVTVTFSEKLQRVTVSGGLGSTTFDSSKSLHAAIDLMERSYQDFLDLEEFGGT